MDLVMISSPPNYKKHSEASEWLPVIPKSLDGTMYNDKDRTVSSRSIWLSRLGHWRSVVSSLPSLVSALGTNHSILRAVWSPTTTTTKSPASWLNKAPATARVPSPGSWASHLWRSPPVLVPHGHPLLLNTLMYVWNQEIARQLVLIVLGLSEGILCYAVDN